MRGTRWLLLVAIAAIIFGVGVTYREQIKSNQQNAVARPAPMPDGVNSTYDLFHWTKTNQATGCKVVVSARGMNEVADSSRSELNDVTLQLFHKIGDKCDTKFDLIRSAAATFFNNENRLVSEGEVDIQLGETDPPTSLISIKSSGATFDTESGRADTDKLTQFFFKNGQGHSVGATYDPPTKELLMKNDVVVDWEAATPHAKPMHIVAPSLQYHEAAAEIDLVPSGKMTRDELTFEGESPIIRMREDGQGHKFIHEIDSTHARGSDSTPGRKLAYSADRIWVFYNDNQVVERIVAEGNAALTSTSETSETNVASGRVEMFFDAHEKEAQLARVNCDGNAVVTSKPLAVAGKLPTDSHVLRSEHISMKMRTGGREIEAVTAHPSGNLEFLPNQPAAHHRTLVGDEMLINYASQNRIEAFHATNVKTTTDPNVEEKKRNHVVSTTSTKDFSARFDPATSTLIAIEEKGNFAYQEGDRKAHADRATFDQKQNVMTLDTGAAVSDATGSTTADHIRMDQATDEFLAEGNVNSVRLPDKDPKNNSSMLSGDSPMNAQARKMESINHAGSHRYRYEGNARLWQGANRINADVVEIDRDKHSLLANGNVVTEAWQQPKDDAKNKNAAPVKTVVTAPHLVYTDTDKLAYYFGDVTLVRPDLRVKSKELHAWLADSKAESQLEKAIADGAVEITGAHKDNSYKGTSEHMEYYTTDQKVILNGGTPKLVRTVKGNPPTEVRERELTYYVDTGHLDGAGAASDRIPPKKKK